LAKKKKGKPQKKDLPYRKNDITIISRSQKPFRYSRNRHKYRLGIWYCGITKKSSSWYLDVIAAILDISESYMLEKW